MIVGDFLLFVASFGGSDLPWVTWLNIIILLLLPLFLLIWIDVLSFGLVDLIRLPLRLELVVDYVFALPFFRGILLQLLLLLLLWWLEHLLPSWYNL